MNWDRIEGSWQTVLGQAKSQWGKLTDDDLRIVAGRRDLLIGKVQERSGLARDEAARQIAEWQHRATDAWFSDDRNHSHSK